MLRSRGTRLFLPILTGASVVSQCEPLRILKDRPCENQSHDQRSLICSLLCLLLWHTLASSSFLKNVFLGVGRGYVESFFQPSIISNKLVSDVTCPGGSMVEHPPCLLGFRARLPAGAFVIYPFLTSSSAKASLPIFPFPFPSTFRLRLKCTLRTYPINKYSRIF